jgi:leucyl-tRNA synthetase
VEIAVQINGKIRTRLMVGVNDDAATVLALAKENERIAPELEGKAIVKELYVPKKLVNIVVKPL